MPQAIGGYDSSLDPSWDPGYQSPPTADCGTILVQNVAGMTNAAVFSTYPQNTETGALWLDTAFNVKSQQLTLSFDISVLQAPSLMSLANSQPMSIDGSADQAGVLFGARLYDTNNGKWAATVNLVPTSADGGVFALRDATGSNNVTFGSYTNGQVYERHGGRRLRDRHR